MRRGIVIPDDLWKKIQSRAKKEDCSASAIVRKAVREYLEKK